MGDRSTCGILRTVTSGLARVPPSCILTSVETNIMWNEIMDMPGEIFDFDQWIEEISSDPEVIAEVERNNAEFDAEVAALSQS